MFHILLGGTFINFNKIIDMVEFYFEKLSIFDLSFKNGYKEWLPEGMLEQLLDFSTKQTQKRKTFSICNIAVKASQCW